MLSDASIRKLLSEGSIGINPPPPDCAIQPASVDLRLGNSFVEMTTDGALPLDDSWIPTGAVVLQPGQCMLATTHETVTLPSWIVGRVEGKSSWGRKFLMVHSTAGFIDPGFSGEITLELKNMSPTIVILQPGCQIAQISFEYLDRPADRPYGHAELGSHYQGQRGATPSRLHDLKERS